MKRLSFLLLILTGIIALASAQPADTNSFRQEGIASWYGAQFAGRPTASGEIFDPALFTAAHPTLPFGTVLTITNKHNMRQVTVRINDRGPFVAARIIDLSMAAAEALDMISTGTAPVILERAVNTALGPAAPPPAVSPVTAPADTPAPVEAAPPPEAAPLAAAETPAPGVPAASPATASPDSAVPAGAVTTAPALPAQSAAVETAPVQTAAYVTPQARILGGIPPITSTKFYRLQVGAYRVPRNAVDAFNKLKGAGLSPAYEQNGDLYRVVLAGLRAGEIPAIARALGVSGFAEALIREESGN